MAKKNLVSKFENSFGHYYTPYVINTHTYIYIRFLARDTTTKIAFQDIQKILSYMLNIIYPYVVDSGVVKSLCVVKTIY